jgi:hypothetical protein
LATPQPVAQKPPHDRQDPLQRLKPEPTPQVRRFLELIQKSQNGQSPAAEAPVAKACPVGRVAQEIVP